MAPKSERHIVARLFANATTKLALATIIAAFCLTVVPIDGAAADVQVSAARAAALQECIAHGNDTNSALCAIGIHAGRTLRSMCRAVSKGANIKMEDRS